jgi:hypothetical protein
MSKILSIASIFLLGVDLALTAPTVQEYRYITAGKEVRRSTSTRPVTFNGVAIGTTELNSTATPGTIHSLLDGHHFYQPGWYLSHTNTDEPVWEYLPDRRNQSLSQPVKRQVDNIRLSINNGQFITESIAIANGIYETLTSTASEISWSSDIGFSALDLFDNGAFVASSTSLVGDLFDIFFNAFEIFA